MGEKKHFVTCGQMRILERRADADGLSYYQMMENAGTGAAAVIMEKESYDVKRLRRMTELLQTQYRVAEDTLETVEKPKTSPNDNTNVYVFCGKGNNGGDGFVVARIMADAGYDVTVILVDGTPKTKDSFRNYELLKDMPVRIVDMSKSEGALMDINASADIIVDAIYGTGFHGKLKGNGLKAAIYINKNVDSSVIFSLDIPSGMGGDMLNENNLDKRCVTADYTLTFHAVKPVHMQRFSEQYTGEVIVIDIGIDEERLWNIEI